MSGSHIAHRLSVLFLIKYRLIPYCLFLHFKDTIIFLKFQKNYQIFLFFYSPEVELVNYSIINFIFSSAMRVSPFSNITSNKDVSPICLPTSKAHLGSPPLVWMCATVLILTSPLKSVSTNFNSLSFIRNMVKKPE